MNNFCGGSKFPKFTFATTIPMMVGNVNPNDYPNDRTLSNAPVGTLLIINELYDPETCTCVCACGLFQKCSTGPYCAGSQWVEINPITPCVEMEAEVCEDPDEPEEDECLTSAIRAWCGRPNNTLSYEYGNVSGSTLEEFNAAWIAAGGQTWIADQTGLLGGECHWFCPAIEGAVFMIDGQPVTDGEVFIPNPRA